MAIFIERLKRSFFSSTPVPAKYQGIFQHLYMEIAWFGLLSGTTIAFIAVYATRQGATPQHIGLLSAVPGLVNLLFALPAGSWLSRRSIGGTVFWMSVVQRSFYLLLVPLPILLLPKDQVWTIILMTLVMSIPGTAMVVGFNSLFGDVVPLEWRGHVVGIRNALLSIVTTVSTLISGEILNRVAFPTGYQIVFALGVIGAGMSSLYLYFLSRVVGKRKISPNAPTQTVTVASRRLQLEIRAIYQRGIQSLRLDAMHGHFARMMGLLFGWHLVQFMTIPVITPFVVNELHISDQLIGVAGSLFNALVFVGSLMLNRATFRFGNKRITGFGIMGLSLFPILTALGSTGYILGNLFGGFAWAMAGGALYNYILEHCPPEDRPAHLAWYSLVANAAILIGSLTGPLVAGQIGFVTALVIFGIGRFLSGVAILRWG